MDPLSDLLGIVRLDGAFFFTVEAAEPRSIESLGAKELAPRIMLAGLRDEVVGRGIDAAPRPARPSLDPPRAGSGGRLFPLQRGQAVRAARRPAADAVP